MDKPFWEKTYRDDAVSTFAKGPTVDIAENWMIFPTSGKVLDVGKSSNILRAYSLTNIPVGFIMNMLMNKSLPRK